VLAGRCWQPPPPGPPANEAGDSISADMCPTAGGPSFWRIVPIPFTAWMAAAASPGLLRRMAFIASAADSGDAEARDAMWEKGRPTGQAAQRAETEPETALAHLAKQSPLG
jgi:hypothetical protein